MVLGTSALMVEKNYLTHKMEVMPFAVMLIHLHKNLYYHPTPSRESRSTKVDVLLIIKTGGSRQYEFYNTTSFTKYINK